MEYNCSICNKIYSSCSSLSNHKKIYHNINSEERKKNDDDNLYQCRYCEKKYKNHRSRWDHEKKCSIQKNKNDSEKILIQNQIIDELKNQINELQTKLVKNNKVSTRTFKAINKLLMERSYIKNSQNTINSHNAITNNIHQICNIGNEELAKVLTMQQKRQIMNSRLNAIEKIVEITHCGEYNQFKNIIITNLKDNYGYKYDAEKGYFITVEKTQLMDDVFIHRKSDIEEIYHELEDANKIDTKTKQIIQKFLDKCESEDPFVDEHETKYQNYKSYKINNIKILLYNNQDKITKDIELLIS
jgi:hypothetical protein